MNQTRQLFTRLQTFAILMIAAIGILAATLASPASAHEGREVGDYNLVVGFLREPAYEGQLNGVSLVVTKATNDPMEGYQMESKEDDHEAMGDMKPDSTVDVITHGAVFISPGIGQMENFKFEVTEELSGIEIPFHIHPGNQEGIIAVSTEESPNGEDQSFMIMDGQLMPAKLEVSVGNTVSWMNHDKLNAVVMSGPLSSMSSDMTAMMDNETPSVTAEMSISTNRVSGLASTLQVEVTHLSTTVSRAMPLIEVYQDPGHYVAEFIPTAPGDYRMRFFGSIEGNPIDETFDSGPDTFDTVIASDAIQFPVVLESNRELQNATQGAIDGIEELENNLDSTASTGMIIGIIGIVFGAIATGFSVFAIVIAKRRN